MIKASVCMVEVEPLQTCSQRESRGITGERQQWCKMMQNGSMLPVVKPHVFTPTGLSQRRHREDLGEKEQ